jgi:hypothetical protein
MSVLTSYDEISRRASRDAAGHAIERLVGLFRRAFNAVIGSRQRQVNDNIARYLQQSGGSLTDEIEREMMQRLTRNWTL